MEIKVIHTAPADETKEMERPVRKMFEHLEDALIHLHQSNLPHHRKVELDGLMTWTLKCLKEAA